MKNCIRLNKSVKSFQSHTKCTHLESLAEIVEYDQKIGSYIVRKEDFRILNDVIILSKNTTNKKINVVSKGNHK